MVLPWAEIPSMPSVSPSREPCEAMSPLTIRKVGCRTGVADFVDGAGEADAVINCAGAEASLSDIEPAVGPEGEAAWIVQAAPDLRESISCLHCWRKGKAGKQEREEDETEPPTRPVTGILYRLSCHCFYFHSC